MKKILYIFLGIILFFLITITAFYFSLPTTISYFLSKAINGNVHIKEIELGHKDNSFVIHLKGVTLKGDVQGTVQSAYLSFGYKKEFCFNEIIIADFDIKVDTKQEGKKRFALIPSEFIALKNGKLKFDNSNIIVHEININHLKYKTPFIFFLHIENDRFFHSIKATGTGKYSRKNFNLKGNANIAGLIIENISENLKGIMNIKGEFSYEKETFTIKGPFEVSDFALKANFLSKPISIKDIKGTGSLLYSKKIFDINIKGIEFKHTPFDIAIKIDSKGLESLTLNSGYFDIYLLKEYIALNYLSKEMGKYVSFVKRGKIVLNKLIYRRDRDFSCNGGLKDIDLSYDDIEVKNISTGFIVNNNSILLKGLQGQYKNSVFKNVTGEINYGKKTNMHLKGNYSLNLIDIPSNLVMKDIKFIKGISEGEFTLNYMGDNDYSFSGNGRLIEGEVLYENVSASVHGYYRFNKEEIEFDPLILKKYNTNLKIRGKWGKDFIKLRFLGILDILHIKPFIKIPFEVKGLVDIDGNIVKEKDIWQLSGVFNMDHLNYKIENYLKKDEGIKNSLSINAQKKHDVIIIRSLNFKLEDLTLNTSVILKRNTATEVKLKLLVPEIKNKGNIFFFNGENPKGNILIDINIKEVSFPINKMPQITGKLEIKNGYFKIPFIPSPLSEINLTAYFNGDSIELTGSNLKCGNSVINSLGLQSKGIDAPQFKLLLDIEYFDYKDFETAEELALYPIRPDNVFASAKGDIVIKAKKAKFENKIGENISLKTFFDNRKFIISEFKTNALNGSIDLSGMMDLSKNIPLISLKGTMNNISGGEFLKLFGEKTHIIESREFIFLDLKCKGNTIKDFKKTLTGNATIYSEDGVIKRMNLLSKIFGLLNIYELFKGEVDLTTSGFRYKTTSANFVVNNGIFTTDDFIIDSPAMVITGYGSLNMVNGTIEGKITVSPLVTIDKIVSKIPILKNILQDKKRGFIYAIYDVKGSIEDPEINLGYIQTIGSLPLNIIKGMIEFPKNLFKR